MGAVVEMMCVCYRGGIVMDVSWRLLCVSMISERVFICSELGNGATGEAEKSLFRPGIKWWRYAHYFVISSCG